jgi:hypothetical protein
MKNSKYLAIVFGVCILEYLIDHSDRFLEGIRDAF